jgi:hypothetical protein
VKACQRVYKCDDPNPILGVLRCVHTHKSADALAIVFQQSMSRYYQVRASSLYTLNSLILMKTIVLDMTATARIVLNNALYEMDP